MYPPLFTIGISIRTSPALCQTSQRLRNLKKPPKCPCFRTFPARPCASLRLSLTSHRLPSTPQGEKNPTTRAAWTVHNTRMRQRQSLVGWVGRSAAGRKWIGGGRTRSLRTPSTAVSVGGDGEFARPCPDLLGPTSPHNRDHGISSGPVC